MDENTQTAPTTQPAAPIEPRIEKNVGLAVAAYFLFFIPLLTDSKDDPFVKFHVKQALLIQLLFIGTSIIFSIVPYFFYLIEKVISLGLLVLWAIGLVNALNGKTKEIPFVGKYAGQWFKF